ncbi:Serine/threonine protein kinase [Metarhizium acridum]|uniref:Serine/threonine protein kinase n=1 Tax=Metarhizium acridum TaxID=92637 RepID=UPI001C6B8A30|nr:Serine/threonine protein kinase [Metarhizium acridum]
MRHEQRLKMAHQLRPSGFFGGVIGRGGTGKRLWESGLSTLGGEDARGCWRMLQAVPTFRPIVMDHGDEWSSRDWLDSGTLDTLQSVSWSVSEHSLAFDYLVAWVHVWHY